MNWWQEKLECAAKFKHLELYIHGCRFSVPFLEYMESRMEGNQGKQKYGVTPGTLD